MSNNESYMDLSDLFGVYEGSAQTPVNTLDKMLGMTGNPLFLYMSGVITARDLRDAVQIATREPVDISNADYYTMLEMDSGDPVLSKAYALIMQGVSVNAAMRSILDSYDASTPDGVAKQDLYFDYAAKAIEDFKASWDEAQKIEAAVSSGEYRVNPDGTVSKAMDPGKAADVLMQMGMPGILQNTFLWDVVPDDNLLAIAATKDEYAQKVLSPFARMIDPATGLLVQKEAQKMAKQATGTARSAYEEMLNRTPEGREYLKKVKTGKTQVEKSKDATDALVEGPAMNIGKIWDGLKGAASGAVSNIKKGIPQMPVNMSIAQIVADKVLGKDDEKVNQNDYWAKMAASYAGRAEQERLRKPLDTARSTALKASGEAREFEQAALQKGTTPAIRLLNDALPFASFLSQTGDKQIRLPSSDPRLRGLSKQELDIFSTLFASGR